MLPDKCDSPGPGQTSTFALDKTYNLIKVTARNNAAFQGPGTGVETLKQAIGRKMNRRSYQP